ncbi:MAG: helix-turn-helix domain-containing protein [Corynebacterium sp.]|uniref:helix-turn-helix domain-containing protein n=1 Tax=Corynebacterium sp. TaxID=1720 RepID=UPI003F8FA56C
MSGIRHVATAPTETRRLGPGSDVTPHSHDTHQIVYASSGVLEVLVPEGTWFTPSVRAVFVPSGTVHSWTVHGSATVHLVGVPQFPGTPPLPFLVPATPLFRELAVACADAGAPVTAAQHRLLGVLTDQLVATDAPPTMLPTVHDPRLRDVQRVVEEDLSATLPLAALGRRVGASERTLSRLFRAECGMGFTTWRHQVRLHRATLLLADGAPVTQVAAACGYSSPSAFITAFRSSFGRTPGSLYR